MVRRIRRETWLVVLLVAVGLVGLPALFVIPAETILFNPAAYHQALAEQKISADYPRQLGELAAGAGNLLGPGGGDSLLGLMQGGQYEAAVRLIFPAEWVQAQADGLIDQFWAYFNFHTDRLALVVDFKPVKARLSGPEAPGIAAALVGGFPPCQGQELLNFGMQLLQGQAGPLPLCRPPDALLGAVNAVAETGLRGGAAALPDTVDLTGALRLPAAVGGAPLAQTWARGFATYRALRAVSHWLPWLALALLGLTGWLARGVGRGPVYWLGAALLPPGVTGLLVILILWLTGRQIVPAVVGAIFGPGLPGLAGLARLLGAVSGRFLLWSALAAWAVTIVGAGLLAAAVWGRRQPG